MNSLSREVSPPIHSYEWRELGQGWVEGILPDGDVILTHDPTYTDFYPRIDPKSGEIRILTYLDDGPTEKNKIRNLVPYDLGPVADFFSQESIEIRDGWRRLVTPDGVFLEDPHGQQFLIIDKKLEPVDTYDFSLVPLDGDPGYDPVRRLVVIGLTVGAMAGTVKLLWWLSGLTKEGEGNRIVPKKPTPFISPEASPTAPKETKPIRLNVPLMGQWDPRWNDIYLGYNEPNPEGKGTIGTDGCLVTSLAMLRSFYGIEDNPETINEKLLLGGGFLYEGYIDRPNTEKILGLENIWESNDYTEAPLATPMDDESLAKARELLSAGTPLVARANLNDDIGNGASEHYLIIKGWNEQDGKRLYLVNDPWTGETGGERWIPEDKFALKVWKIWAYKVNTSSEEDIDISGVNNILPSSVNFETFSWEEPKKIIEAKYWPMVKRWEPLTVKYLKSTYIGNQTLYQYIESQGLNPIVWAVSIIWIESNGKPGVVNPNSDATGLGQVMPRDGKGATYLCSNGPCFADRPTQEELKDPETNMKEWMEDVARKISAYGFIAGMDSYGNAKGYANLSVALHNTILGQQVDTKSEEPQLQNGESLHIPEGYESIAQYKGVEIYRKGDYDVVAVVHLDQGASIFPIYQLKKEETQVEKAIFKKNTLQELINLFPEAVFISTGSFFGIHGWNDNMLNHPLKVSGNIITFGWADPTNNYVGYWRMLILGTNEARIFTVPEKEGNPQDFIKAVINDPNNFTVITGLSHEAPKDQYGNVGRTFIGVIDGGKTLVLRTSWGPLANVSQGMSRFGILPQNQVQLDGGSSTNLAIRSNGKKMEIIHEYSNIPMGLAVIPTK